MANLKNGRGPNPRKYSELSLRTREESISRWGAKQVMHPTSQHRSLVLRRRQERRTAYLASWMPPRYGMGGRLGRQRSNRKCLRWRERIRRNCLRSSRGHLVPGDLRS